MDLLHQESLVQNLLECLEDTYESNQIKALSLLRSLSHAQLSSSLVSSFSLVFINKQLAYPFVGGTTSDNRLPTQLTVENGKKFHSHFIQIVSSVQSGQFAC